MSRRGDCIHKRKDNRWEGRYIKEYVCGKAKYASVYGKTYSETKQKLNEYINKSSKQQQTSITTELFSESIYDWLNHIKDNIKLQSYHQYTFCAEKYVIPHIGQLKSKDINSHIINELLSSLSKNGKSDGAGGLSESTLNSVRYIIMSTLHFLIDNKKIANITGKVSISKKSKRTEPEIFTNDEFLQLERFLYQEMNTSKLGVLLCMYTGLRIGEVCALQWKDIDLDEKCLSVTKNAQRIINSDNDNSSKTSLQICLPKTEYSVRRIPLTRNLIHVIKALISNVNKEHFIITNTEKIPDPRTLENKYKRYLREADISAKNFHVLRHSFASRCIESGMDIKSLSSILGHSTVTITMNRYVHPSVNYKLEQMERMLLYYGQINGQNACLSMSSLS